MIISSVSCVEGFGLAGHIRLSSYIIAYIVGWTIHYLESLKPADMLIVCKCVYITMFSTYSSFTGSSTFVLVS